jgi:hypothetical protein
MQKTKPTVTPWIPSLEAERALVLEELDAILTSYHFRGSKRYPGLLRYVVEAALNGQAADLKERTLGVEVFGRDPQYDTNTDPVVRISAGEVRKRIAQYYHENQETARVRIELPLGSYAPEFLLNPADKPAPDSASEPKLGTILPQAPSRRFPYRILWASLAALLVVASFSVTYSYRHLSASGATSSSKLLSPLVQSQRPILIVVGASHPDKIEAETPETSFSAHTTGPYHHVSLGTAIALANVAGMLRQVGRSYEVKEDNETSLTDIRSRSLILIGATNNTWTMRLLSPLRYRFIRGTVVQLQDSKDLKNTEWSIDFSKPYVSIAHDFGMVARFYDSTTEGPVLVVAGVGPYGTEAASEFIVNPEHLGDLDRKLPSGWENRNFQVVLKTDVIDSKAGPPEVVAQTIW